MADAESNLRIKITSAADTSGTDKAAQSLRQMNAEAAKQVQASSELSEKGKQYVSQLNAVQAEAGKVELKHREIREIVNHLTREMPELGLVARYALNPYIASLGVALFAINNIVEAHKKMAEMFNERIDISGIKGMIEAMGDEGLAGSFAASAAGAKNLYDELDRISKTEATIVEKTNLAIEALRRQSEINKGEQGAQEKLHEAQINADLASGKITPAQAAFALNANAQRFDKAKNDEADILERDVIEAKKKELEKSKAFATGGEDKLSELEIRSRSAAAEAARLDKEAEGAKKVADDQRAYYDKYLGSVGFDSDKEGAKRQTLYALQLQAEGKAQDAHAAADSAKADFKEFSEQLNAAATALKQLKEAIRRLEQEHADNAATRNYTADLTRRTAGLGLTAKLGGEEGINAEVDSTMAGAVHALVDRHKGISTAEDKAALASLENMLASAGYNSKAIIEMLYRSANLQDTANKEINALKKRFADIPPLTSSTGPHH